MSPERFKAYSNYVGVPYVDKGRTPAGWDCYGLYHFVLAQMMGVQAPSYADEYTSATDEASASAALAARGLWQRVAPGAEAEGDGVVFTIAGRPLHCGYVLTRGTMLHALRGRDTVVEPYTRSTWNKRIEGFYKWKS